MLVGLCVCVLMYVRRLLVLYLKLENYCCETFFLNQNPFEPIKRGNLSALNVSVQYEYWIFHCSGRWDSSQRAK